VAGKTPQQNQKAAAGAGVLGGVPPEEGAAGWAARALPQYISQLEVHAVYHLTSKSVVASVTEQTRSRCP